MSPPLSNSLESLESDVHKALILWHKHGIPDTPSDGLVSIQRMTVSNSGDSREASNHMLLTALGVLQRTNEREAILLKKRFVEGKSSFVVANELNIAESTLFKIQKQAIFHLTKIIMQIEKEDQSRRAIDFDSRVPPRTYDRLFCESELPDQLRVLLSTPGPPWIVVLTGLGGIGKTALADMVFRQLILNEHVFSDFAWVSAQQQSMDPRGFIKPVLQSVPTVADLTEMLCTQLLSTNSMAVHMSGDEKLRSLQSLTRQNPHLVVVDNLETLSDLQTLIPQLRKLANPTKFLLTSREALPFGPDIFQIAVPELSSSHSISLVRHEAVLRDLRDVVDADPTTLHSIFNTVGGNPLALKLVVGQLSYLSLDRVIMNLREARGSKSDDLYRYIYWNSWNQLTPDAQSVLLLMPLFSDGGTELANIERIIDLDDNDLQSALEQLIGLSLINVTGTFRTRRYGIHRLTETFLLREVIKWTDPGPA